MIRLLSSNGCISWRRTVQKVHQTTKGKNEEVELLHQLSFSRRMLVATEVLCNAAHRDAMLQQDCDHDSVCLKKMVGILLSKIPSLSSSMLARKGLSGFAERRSFLLGWKAASTFFG
jgi:hypothetical protein